MAGNIQGKITIRGADEAQRELRKTKQASDFATEAGEAMSGRFLEMATGAGAVTAGIAAMRAAIDLAARAARAAAEAIYHLAQRAGEVSAVSAAFERMAGRDTLTRLQAVTASLVDNVTLAREYNQIRRAGMLTEQEIVDAFGLITRAAQDTDESIENLLQTFARGAAGGGMEFFSALGVNYAQITTRVREAGETMESVEGKSMALREGLRMLAEQTRGTSNEASNTGDALRQMETALSNLRDTAARYMGENRGLVASISESSAAVEGLIPLVTRLATILGHMLVIGIDQTRLAMLHWASAAQTVGGVIQIVNEATGQSRGLYDDFAEGLSAVANGMGDVGEQARRAQARVADLNRSFSEMAAGLGERGFQTIGGAAYAGAPAAGAARRRGGGGGGGSPYAGPASMGMGEGFFDELAAASEASRERQQAARVKGLQEELALEEQRTAEMEAQRLLRERHLEQQDEMRRVLGELVNVEKGLRDEQMTREIEAGEIARERMQAERDYIMSSMEAAGNAFGTMAAITGQIIAQQEAAGESAEEMKAVQGSFLIAYNAVMAATEVAKAIGAAPVVPLMIAHAMSAAAHVAAAVMAATQLGGGSAAAASAAAATPTSTFAGAQAPEPTRDGDRGVTIHQQYLLSETEAGMARVMERAEWQRRRQYRSSRSDAVRYGA